MSDTDGPLSENETNPDAGLKGPEAENKQMLEDTEGRVEICRLCISPECSQETSEEVSEEILSELKGREEEVNSEPQTGLEEPPLHWGTQEDLTLQQWADGSSYRGNCSMNLKLGVGEFKWANGESYVGEFYKDHHHGKGVYSWPDDSRFFGSFYLSRKEGYGTMTFTDGRKFQGLYKSDVRFGPGFESYSDGCQDVGIWMGHHLFRLCTVLPGSVSMFSFPEFSQCMKVHEKGCGSDSHHCFTEEEERKAEDPFLFRYKILLQEDTFTLPDKIYCYSSDTDHLPITPTQHLEFDQHFYRDYEQQEKSCDAASDDVQPSSVMGKIYGHVNRHRNNPEYLKWNITSIMNGDRDSFGPKGPREVVAEQLIVAAGLGDYETISTILRQDLAHVDVSDNSGLTALQAAAVNGHNNVINLLLDNGADVNKSNDEGLAALSLCLVLFYSSKPFWPNVAERNLPPIKEESSDLALDSSEMGGGTSNEKEAEQNDTENTVSEKCLQSSDHEIEPESAALDLSTDPPKERNLRSSINLLLLRGADPDLCATPMHPLFFAVKAADVETVQLLLECGAHTDIRLDTQYGSITPLHIAAALPVAEGIRITEILLCAASDPSASAEDEDFVYHPDRGESPGAVLGFPMKGCLDSNLLLYNYCEKSPNVPEEGGRTPLHVACEREDNHKFAKNIVSLLLAHHAKLNTLWSGHSPLSLAIASGNDSAVKELLANGADPNLPLSRGVGSALCAAVTIAYEDRRTLHARIALVDRLIKAGANILMPILIGEGKRTALGTATDYAYYKYFQDKKIAHTPYHALSPEEKDIYNARKQLLEHLGRLTREAALAKEWEWAKEGIVRGPTAHREPERQLSTQEIECKEGTHRKVFFKYCYHCGRSVGVKLSPCLRCYRIYTCSKQCKMRVWTELHKDECFQLSGKLSSKMTSAKGRRSSPAKSLHADRESSGHAYRDHPIAESPTATADNYSFN
ncbi:ankyrin repeat and MYND domain-containing protein 1 [Hyperolius riggenbachi]|uniref:ankyrin repeat and MYND domain-containing protein 1 n=1 Tax=Hyperolius riggenbachi TaxID=752182 RepID=UPI0035A32D05